MHYVPESAGEFLPSSEGERLSERSALAMQWAPLLLLTLGVGTLLLTDLVLAAQWWPSLTDYREPFGYRLAFWAALLGGGRILFRALDALIDKQIGVDLALAIAVLAALGIGEPVTAALVVVIALCGELLEYLVVDRTQSAIRSQLATRPDSVTILEDGRERTLAQEELRVGMTVLVRPGQRVPVDGLVSAGTSAVDEAALTGEPLPIDKTIGSQVWAGTINRYGTLSVRVVTTGTETRLGQVLSLLEAAAERKTRGQRTADRLAAWFLPFVLLAAVGTFLGWWLIGDDFDGGILAALAVLVVACPCPLVLATPTAIMATFAHLAHQGILTRSAAALEHLANIDHIVFDKTGTLTSGTPHITTIHTAGDIDEQTLLTLTAAAERNSEHPLGRMIVREAERRGIIPPLPSETTITPGGGVTASFEGEASPADIVRVGNWNWLREHLSESNRSDEPHPEAIGTRLHIATGDRWRGVILVEDEPRGGVSEMLTELRRLGLTKQTMLTGDRQSVANHLAQMIGFEGEVVAEQTPESKAEWIANAESSGDRVVMVGDGLNDALAIARATVGVAVHSSRHDLTAHAGDLVLLGSPVAKLVPLLRASRRLVQNIQQSVLWFAVGVNGLGVALSAWGSLSPVQAAIFHEIASLLVMLNAMRLLRSERISGDELESAPSGRRSTFQIREAFQTISPAKASVWIVDRAGMLTKLTLGIVTLLWLGSNIVLVRSDETAIVTRFGRMHEELSPGMWWRWPKPFEQVHRWRIDEQRVIRFGGGDDSEGESVRRLGWVEWSAPHRETTTLGDHSGDVLPSGRDAGGELVLVREGLPIEIVAELHYRISDPLRFRFGVATPERLLAIRFESTLRAVAANETLDDILTARREVVEAETQRLLRAEAKRLDLGLTITGVHLLDVHPPVAVVEAYRDVANAREGREQQRNEAETYAEGTLLRTVGEGVLARLPEETGDDTAAIIDAELWSELVTTDDAESLLSGRVASMLSDARQTGTARTWEATAEASRIESLLPVLRKHPHLTRQHLRWVSVIDLLKGKRVTLLDPNAAPSTRMYLRDR